MNAMPLTNRAGTRGRAAALCIFFAATCALFPYSRGPETRLGATSSPAKAKKPNIVFILTDDLSTNLIQYMPNVLAMQKDGRTFSAAVPACPGRNSHVAQPMSILPELPRAIRPAFAAQATPRFRRYS